MLDLRVPSGWFFALLGAILLAYGILIPDARAALTDVSLSIPIIEGELMLGVWQGVYLFEHRRAPHSREVAVHILGA